MYEWKDGRRTFKANTVYSHVYRIRHSSPTKSPTHKIPFTEIWLPGKNPGKHEGDLSGGVTLTEFHFSWFKFALNNDYALKQE